jgi:hypothetical protein
MKFKALPMDEAIRRGYRAVRYGMRYYIPVALPESRFCDSDLISDQYDPQWEDPANASKDDPEGYAVQVVEDVHGRIGLPGMKYVVRYHYSPNDGVQDWDFYGALEVA